MSTFPSTAKRLLRRLGFPVIQRAKGSIVRWRFQRLQTGVGTYVDPSAHVLGWRSVRIGDHSVVSEDCWLNVNHRSLAEIQIDVGNFCHLGRRNFLSSGRLLKLGDYCLTGPDCRFVGSNHLFDDPFVPYVASGAEQNAVTEIGANCWFGAGAMVLGDVKIGHGSVIGALTLVNRDVPPFSVVVGNPGRVIKRYDLTRAVWARGHSLTREQEDALPDEQAYLALLRASHPRVDLPIAAASRSMGDLP